jgi:hypothetical protein
VRIGKPLIFDLAGCSLFTGTTLGADDPDFEANRTDLPALWDDMGEQSDADFEYENLGRTWPKHRVVLLIAASDVAVVSTAVGARIQGAARTVQYRSPDVVGRQLSTGCVFDSTLEMQHGIRIGGTPGPYSDDNSYSNILLDLTNISVEFVHGDGVYLGDNHHRIRITGQNLGEHVLGGSTHVDDAVIQGWTGQGGEVIEGTTVDDDRWEPDDLPLPGIHHTGRQGIATDYRNYDLLVDGLAIWRTGRAIIDLEPASCSPGLGDAEILRPTVRDIETGIHHLLWIPAAGRGRISDLVVRDTVNYEQITVDTRPNPTECATIERHTNWLLENNAVVSGVTLRRPQDGRGRAIFELTRIDGLTVIDNDSRIRSGHGPAIEEGTSTDVVIDPAGTVQFPEVP